MTAAAGGAEMTEKTRIYVGGLGNGVTEDDLRRTFSALGEVVAVDIVRTKGRSFAYLDFLPSSDKSLSKLFSTYNGCMWKGGKLRLEKAKEHFLIRLRREWQENAECASEACSHDADPSESHNSLEKPKKPSTSDNMKLRVFFPKLGKVKSLASAGIGKHKYSFQRVQVPSVPNHFCDCAEHSGPFLTAKGKSTSAFEDEKNLSEFESASAGINEQELNIMNSVMNKLFEREKLSKQTITEPELVNGGGDSTNSGDELLASGNDDEDHLTDEDNLIINVVSKKSDSMDLLREMRTVVVNQEPVAKKLKPSNDRKPKNDHDSQRKKTVPLSKNKKSTQSEVNDGSTYTVITEMARNPEIRLNTRGESRTEIESGSKQLEGNSSRSKKSTWKDLISQKGNTSFSISDVISKVPQEKKEESSGDDLNPRLAENVHDQEKMILHRKKKRKSDTSRDKTVSSVPEMTMNSQMHMNTHEDTTRELESVTQQISTPDALPIVIQQKEEEPRTDDLDVPLPIISQAFCISDIRPSVPQQNGKEPRDDNPDVLLTKNMEIKNLDQHENAERQTDSKDLEKPNEASPGKQNEDTIQMARGASWRHKSSWTQLISSTNDSPFSISQFVPSPSLAKHEQQVDVLRNSTSDLELRPGDENLNTGPATVMVPASNDQSTAAAVDAQEFSGKDHEGISKKNEVSSSSLIKKKTPERRRTLSLGDLDSEEMCPFMRTEASMKEWRKLKAGARGSHKKKRSVEEST